MKSRNLKLNKAKTKKFKKNKLSIIKEKITLLDSNISELYKIYSLTKKQRVDKEKKHQIIINRINYLTDEERKLRLKCEIQMKKIALLSKTISRKRMTNNDENSETFNLSQTYSNSFYHYFKNSSFVSKNKKKLNNSTIFEEEKRMNSSFNNKIKNNHIKIKKKNLIRINFIPRVNYLRKNSKSPFDSKRYKEYKKKETEKRLFPTLSEKGKNKVNRSVKSMKAKKFSTNEIKIFKKKKTRTSKEHLNINKVIQQKTSNKQLNSKKNNNVDENKNLTNISIENKNNEFQNFLLNTSDLNLNKSQNNNSYYESKVLTTNNTEDKNKINEDNIIKDKEIKDIKNMEIKRKKEEKKKDRNDEKLDFKIRKIRIIKKKKTNDSRNDLYQNDSTKVTYDFIINDDNIYYNDNNYNVINKNLSDILNNNDSEMKNFTFSKNDEKIQNVISNNNNTNDNLKQNGEKVKGNKKIIKTRIDNKNSNFKKIILAKKLQKKFKLRTNKSIPKK